MSRKRGKRTKDKSKRGPKPPRPPKPPKAKPPRTSATPSAFAKAVDRALVSAYQVLSPIFLQTPGSPLSGIRGQLSVHLPTEREFWILVTYGLASKLGFELTLRVPKGQLMEIQPPRWALLLLSSLSELAVELERPFLPGNRVNLGGPISLDDPTQLRAAAFLKDPTIKAIEGDYATQFVQVVGLSGPELEAGSSWDLAQLMDLILERVPLGITDLDRECLLKTDPELRQRVQEGIEREGSTEEAATLDILKWKISAEGALELTLGALPVSLFQGLLKGRTRHQRPFELFDPDHQVTVRPGEALSHELDPEDERHLTVTLPEGQVARVLAELKPLRGTYAFDGWSVEVVESVITNELGTVIDRVG